MSPRFFAPWLLVSAASLAPGLARAAEPSPSDLNVARALFSEGLQAEQASHWAVAADKFRRAVAIKDTPGLRFHLARCEEEQGLPVEALADYERARSLIEGGVKAVDVERLLPEAIERTRARVSRLSLVSPSGVDGLQIQVDGRALAPAALSAPVSLDPGKHELRASAPGRKPFATQVQLAPGEQSNVAIELPPLRGASPAGTPVAPPAAASPGIESPPATSTTLAPTPQRSDSNEPSSANFASLRVPVLIGEGVVFVGALAGGIYFASAKADASDRMAAADHDVLEVVGNDPNGSACSRAAAAQACARLSAARADRDRAGTREVVSFAVAGVSAAALGLTYWLWPTHNHPQVRAAVAPQSASVWVETSF
jgi:hypothetical protein